MFHNLKFKYKIFIIPLLATLTFIVLFVMTQSFTRKNERFLQRNVSYHASAWELSRDLLEMLVNVHRDLQEAVTAKNETLAETDRLRDQFIQRIEKGRENDILESAELDKLNALFLDYYTMAREASQRMIRGQLKKNNESSLAAMTQSYQNIKGALESNVQRDKKNMVMGFALMQKNNRSLMVASSSTIIICVFLLYLVSLYIIKSITDSLRIFINLSEKVANGDLTVSVSQEYTKDEVGILIKTFQKMVENLRELTSQIKGGANALASSAGQISTSVAQIASAATETASAASETSTTVEEVRQTSMDSNRKAKNVSESAQKAVQISQTGEQSVLETINGMHHIEEQMASIAESILKLSEHGQAIGSIIATVEDVAEQSRLLAVNASIEAVKAGEHGKGFAVVAQEVRSLAEQSKQATSRVRSILDDIQKATSEAVMKTEQGSKAVDAGVKLSAEAGEAIKRLASAVAEAAQATTQISVSAQEQLVGMDQVVSAMESIKQASNQNVTATKQVESASHDLYNLGQNLKKQIELYKL